MGSAEVSNSGAARADHPLAPTRGPSRSDYGELAQEIRRLGLLHKRYGYYFLRLALTLGIGALGWGLLIRFRHSPNVLLVAPLSAFASGQAATISHDAGHGQIAGSRRVNDMIALVYANLLLGVSFGWWIDKHNRHHSHPNLVDSDPDVCIGPLAFTQQEALEKRGVNRFITKYQAYLFFPLLSLEGLHMRITAARFLVREKSRYRGWEILAVGLHFLLYLGALAYLLSPSRFIAFVVIHQSLLGLYLGCLFAPNHKGMEVQTEPYALDFLRRQVLTSRNLRTHRLLNFVWGGANYQIEHHLFPTMPCNNLKRAQPVVRAFCKEHGIPYREEPALQSYLGIVRYLHTVSRPLRSRSMEEVLD